MQRCPPAVRVSYIHLIIYYTTRFKLNLRLDANSVEENGRFRAVRSIGNATVELYKNLPVNGRQELRLNMEI